MCINTFCMGVSKVEPDLSRWCPAKGRVIGHKLKDREFAQTLRKIFPSGPNRGEGCPDSCGISICEGSLNLTGGGPAHPAVVVLVLGRLAPRVASDLS